MAKRVRVLLAAPRGFCTGVRRAIDAVLEALDRYGAPVYVRRPIVHNLEVVRGLEAKGAVFVEESDDVPKGSVVIFSAHGVSPSVKREARERGLVAYDAMCPLVAKVHREVERHERNNRQIILVGHAGHPEIDGIEGHIHRTTAIIVNSAKEVEALSLDRHTPTAYAVQTTYSVQDAAKVVDALKERFFDLSGPASSDICYATSNRQAATREIAARSDAVIVVGESFSSNATRLLEVASSLCPSADLVSGPAEIDWAKFRNISTVGIV